MGGYGLYPLWLLNLWGWPDQNNCDFFGFIGPVYGTNPAYDLDSFFSFYPKFFGASTPLSGCVITIGLNTVTVPSANGLALGQFVQNASLPTGTVIAGIAGTTVTMSQAAIASDANATLVTYQNAPIPASVIQAYINLATASLSQAMWQEQWQIAMGWFVAHYCTLWAQTEASEMQTVMQTVMHGETPQGAIPGTVYTLSSAPPGGVLGMLIIDGLAQNPSTYSLSGNTITLGTSTAPSDSLYAVWPIQQASSTTYPATAAQIAAQALSQGILSSKSVGDVSASYESLKALEDWGQWVLTRYGQQLTTAAKVIGSGPAWVW